eukprot:1379000-Alexandrium_andersonii.AAC.1
MSASLVGSEMCIRDRVSAKHGTAQPKADLVAIGEEYSQHRGLHLGVGAGCLLYTSDAADDM